MMRNGWKVILAGMGLIVLNAPGLGAAKALEEVPPAPTDAEVSQVLAYLDAEVTQVVNEMGGTLAICPACPPGINCCTANCILTCCTIVCAEGATPHCSCTFATNAVCFCDPPPKPKCLEEIAATTNAVGVVVIGDLVAKCAGELVAIGGGG